MAYDPPTRGEMVAVIRRSLRDVNGDVFAEDVIGDFINEGLADLSLYRPVETQVSHTYVPEDGEDGIAHAADDLSYVYGIEMGLADPSFGFVPFNVPPNMGSESAIRNGWEMAGGLRLSAYWGIVMADLATHYEVQSPVALTIYGYRDRNLPLADDDVLDLLNPIDAWALGSYCKVAGFTLLESDRALYQQWIASTNNTDVSPTQLQGMRSQAEISYERIRARSRVIRRAPVLGYQYVS